MDPEESAMVSQRDASPTTTTWMALRRTVERREVLTPVSTVARRLERPPDLDSPLSDECVVRTGGEQTNKTPGPVSSCSECDRLVLGLSFLSSDRKRPPTGQ